MSTVKVFSSESDRCSPPNLPLFPITSFQRHSLPTNILLNNQNFSLKPNEKKIQFEIKTNNFNRNIEIKTKQEDEIFRINKISPTIKCSTESFSKDSHQMNSLALNLNNPIERVRVSISSNNSPYENENIEKESLNEEIKFNHRPLFNLVNQSNIEKNQKNILPSKQFLPFKPTILHKKSQESIDQFPLFDFNKENTRNGVIRSHTFTTSNSPHDPSIISPLTSSSNKIITNASLSTSDTSLTNGTPTSNDNLYEKNEAKRKAIAMQMYETEKSYVEALKNLVTKYYLPMKDKDIVSNDLINDIFYKIPEIHIHQTAFLISLSQKMSQWDNKQTIGDLLLQMFTRTSIIETYTSFVNNYRRASIAIGLCREFSSFNKFVEQQIRDHRGKLSLNDLIIQPVQRIPRYELFLKDFLKCTNVNHPDYQLLLKAQSEIHSLAEQIDQVQKEVHSNQSPFFLNNSLEIIQDLIENVDDLIKSDRYYIYHNFVTLESSSGLKKDRCLFLFNDLILITSTKRKNTKLNNSIILNSPSGKQYIDNTKHKLIMKIPIESVDLATDHLKKHRSSVTNSPSLKKRHSIGTIHSDKLRLFQEDLSILNQINDLAKTLNVPHQNLDDSIKDLSFILNKHLNDETNHLNDSEKSNSIQFIINTDERTETIHVLFSSTEQKNTWENHFIEAKKLRIEIAAGRRNITFRNSFILPKSRPGNELTCGLIRSNVDDLCICNSEGEIYVMNIDDEITLKSSNKIISSQINTIGFIPSNKTRKNVNSIKIRHDQHKQDLNKKSFSINNQIPEGIHSFLDSDSTDDDDDDNLSLNNSSIHSFDLEIHNEDIDTRLSTIWIGTQSGQLYIYESSSKIFGRKNRIVKQLNYSIHSILYTDNKVFVALNHGQLCLFKRDFSGRWDFDNPIIRSIQNESDKKNGDYFPLETNNPISVLTLAAGKLWCAIKDKIFIVCPNSLNVQHSFLVDDYQRHVISISTGGSSINHVWIATQDSHDIRLYHATNFTCLLETSIRQAVLQKLQVSDDIIRSHKLGCLHISSLYVCKEALWIGTSAGIIINLTISQIIDSLSNNEIYKLNSNSIQLKGLPFGHSGPVKFIYSIDKTSIQHNDQNDSMNTFVITLGNGFEDFDHNDENLGKDDHLYHLILWKL